MDKPNQERQKVTLMGLIMVILIMPLVFVFTLLMIFIVFIIPAPFEYYFYKKSLYCSELKIKYRMGITRTFGYKVYKFVRENEDLEFFVQGKERFCHLKSGNVFLLAPIARCYRYVDGEFYAFRQKNQPPIMLKDIKELYRNQMEEDLTNAEIRILVKERFFKPEHLRHAQEEGTFIFYKEYKDFCFIKA